MNSDMISNIKYKLLHTMTVFCIGAYLLLAVFMPNDTFMLKKMFFVAVLALNALIIAEGIFIKSNMKMISVWGCIIPLFLVAYSIFVGDGKYVTDSISRFYFFATLLFVFPIFRYNIDYEVLIVKILTLLAVFIVLPVLLDMLGCLDIYDNKVLMYLDETDNAMVGKSPDYMLYYIIFIKTTPLLLIPVLYYIHNSNKGLAFLSFFGLLFSGTRANVFIGIIAGCYMLIHENKRKNTKILMALIGAVCLCGLLPRLYVTLVHIFEKKAVSDAVRLGIIKSMLKIYSDPLNLLFGTGFGSVFYNFGRNELVNTCELSYMEVVRQGGIFTLMLLCWFWFFPVKKLWNRKEKRYVVVAYLGYLVIAGTNPLLLSTTAFLMYLYVYYMYYKLSEREPF